MAEQITNASLFEWQCSRLERLRNMTFRPRGMLGVTVVIYHFWDDVLFDRQFDAVECAIYTAWQHCGLLKTRLVTNRSSNRIEAFASKFGGWFDICVNPFLIPGSVPSMSVDCNANLFRYFDTDYVLVIQNDGFPLRAGLEEFVGRYDYVGAPFVRKTKINRLVGLWPRFAVGNGGFSLRSRKICELASYYWIKRYKWMPHDWRFVREDVFFCVLLPFLEPNYRAAVRFAPCEEAKRFSYDCLYNEDVQSLPFGFHGNGAFQYLTRAGLLASDGRDIN